MRDKNEIERVEEEMANVYPEGMKLDDNFQYGMLMGKQIALEWVIRSDTSPLLSMHYTYEDWIREGQYAGQSLREAMGLEEEKKEEDDKEGA